MLAFVFPGQGSQKKGMGADLFDQVPEFVEMERQVDQLLGYSMRALCLQDPNDELGKTQFTQPALYTVNALHYYRAVEEGRRPQFLAGHSLGEYNALLAAGAFDFLTGLRIVQKRGELMAQATNGAMAAVINLSAEQIVAVLQQEGLAGVDIANYNSPSQTVISGPPDEIESAIPAIKAAGARLCVPLAVSGAFHSRYMADAARRFDEFLRDFQFNELKIPVVANVTGQPYPAEEPDTAIPSLLVKQISQSVRWTDSILQLLDRGVSEFEEVGPGKVLTKLIQQIRA